MKKYLPLLWISPLVLVLDQLSKLWIVRNLPLGNHFAVIPGYFDIIHTKNRGAAFGILSGWDSGLREWFFYGISLVALIALFSLYWQSRPDNRRLQVPLALILGGAIGNLLDRIFHGMVTDFLLFHWQNKIADFTLFGENFRFPLSWPAFNIADTAITCGALYLILRVAFSQPKES